MGEEQDVPVQPDGIGEVDSDLAGTVVVTGASTGIGYATTALLARQRYRVVATVRTHADAELLRAELGPRVEPVLVDVIEDDQIAALTAFTQALVGDGGLAGLVNNAGIAVAGPLMHLVRLTKPSDRVN